MKKKKFIFILLLIVIISVGFSAISATLSITGNSTIARNTWDVHFENVQVTSGSVTASTPVISNNDTQVTYNVTLNMPGDFYEFTVDAVNEGTIDAMIQTFSNTGLTTEQEKYLSYSIKYANGIDVENKHLLAHGSSATYKVRVEYRNDIDSTDLPDSDQTISLTFSVNYIQADGNSKEVPHSIKLVFHSNGYNPITNVQDTQIINYVGDIVSKECIDNKNCSSTQNTDEKVYQDTIELIVPENLTTTNIFGREFNNICTSYDDDNYLCFKTELVDSIKELNLDCFFDGFLYYDSNLGKNQELIGLIYKKEYVVDDDFFGSWRYSLDLNENYFANLYKIVTDGVVHVYPSLEYIAS